MCHLILHMNKRNIISLKDRENYSVCSVGTLDGIADFAYQHPLVKGRELGKVFVGEALHTTSMEISFQVLSPKEAIPFVHRHRTHEEVYIILQGRGIFTIDDEVTEVSEGSLIRIAPNGKRTWSNPYDKPMLLMVLQGVSNSLKQHTIFDGYVE